jgi:hypothetical protein
MKVVNIPSTKMMNKEIFARVRASFTRVTGSNSPYRAAEACQSSLRAKRSNPSRGTTDGWIASSLRSSQ